MKHLKLFETTTQYESWKSSNDYITPSVVFNTELDKVYFNPYIPPLGVDVIPDGVSIYGIDGRFYTPEEWVKSGNSNEDAIGVAICDINTGGTYRCPPFVIHPSEGANLKYSNAEKKYSGVTSASSSALAEEDFNGETNTKWIVMNEGSSVTDTGPAYANGITFKHGKKGYVPAAGELDYMFYDGSVLNYYDKINECLNAINGVLLDKNKDYWSSTAGDDRFSAWQYSSSTHMITKSGNKLAQKYVRAIAKL